MRKLLLYASLWLLLGPRPAIGADVALVQMTKDEELASTRLVLEFSSPPKYRMHASGQRLDLILSDVSVAPTLKRLPEDDTVVKVIFAESGEDLMVSFLLRRPPARVVEATSRGSARIVLDLFWEEGAARPAIAFRVAGLPSRRPDGAIASRELTSAYGGSWERFFEEYRTPLEIALPLRFSLAALPWGREEWAEGSLEVTLHRLAADGDWPEIRKTMTLMAESGLPKGEEGEEFRLLWAEALLRTGDMEKALVVLSGLLADEPSAPHREHALFLRSFVVANSGSPRRAFGILAEIAGEMSARSPYRPYCALLQGEAALAAGDYSAAPGPLGLAGTEWPASLRPIRDLRFADALAANGEISRAMDAYRPLLGRSGLLMKHPFSLSSAAAAFMAGADYDRAAALYGMLARQEDMAGDLLGLVMVAEASAAEGAGEKIRAKLLLSKVWTDFSDTEAGARARLRLYDEKVLTGSEIERRRLRVDYGHVARDASARALREEAAFKEALLLYLLDEFEAGVETLARVLRDFHSGPLALEAKALMRQMLPKVIAARIEGGEGLQALVLVERYRDLLVSGAIPRQLLLDVAKASTRLGLFDRASRVYIYMLDAEKGRVEEEAYYLPLLEVASDRGAYRLVRTYALRYLTRFPDGGDRDRIYYLQVRALQKEGLLEEAADLLMPSLRPRGEALEALATEIFWSLERFEEVAACFEGSISGPPKGLILKAEALCRIGRCEEAIPIFEGLMEQESFGEQATFRYGEILRAGGREEEGLKVLRRLAAGGERSLWSRLAEESLLRAKL